MQINLRLCYVLVIMIYVHFLQAQSSITSAGGAGVGTGGKLSFSVGQTTYNYTSSATATLSEGVHQPYEISIIKKSFGIGCSQQGLEEIGENYGLSRERVRQIREKSIMKIRNSGYAKILTKYLG